MDIVSDNPRAAEPEQPAPPPAEIKIGEKIKRMRVARKLTLQRASERTGVALSTISKIERDELSPTISTLQRIAIGFGVDVVTLLADSDVAVRAPGRRSVTRAVQGRHHPTSTCDNLWLCTDLAQKQMIPIRTRVRARSPDDYAEWAKHDSEIFVFVLKGTLVIHSSIYEPMTLQEGDCMYYDASSPHLWVSEGETDAEVIWLYANY